MNKVFSIVWNHTLQTWTVASEKASRRGKRTNARKRTALGAVIGGLLSTASFAATPTSNELPTNGQVAAGQLNISQSSNTMNINQSSQQGIINWQTFNVGSDATVNFVQPNSNAATLNRVTSGGASQILGNMNANGQVFVINPNGVLFGHSARVDVGGLVASSLDIANEDFMAGNYQLSGDGSAGAVINQGELLARYVAMLAPEVRNEGVIVARQGTVALAAGETVTLSISGEQLIDVQVSQADFNTLVENRHLVQADDGLVIMSAQSASNLLGQTVNTGAVSAGGIVSNGGTVRLVASSEVVHSGTINVNAGQNGDGGTAVLLANLDNPASQTDVSGSISAKGGAESGNGGFIETSASDVNIADSAAFDTSAVNGKTGEWLIDPTDFTIGVNGDITSSALETQLASSNVTIESVSGAAGVNGDIFVQDSLSWNTNALTLTADRNIEINAPISVTAGGGLNLEYGQSGSAGDTQNKANYFISAPVDLASDTTFTTTFGNDGVTDNYTVITDEAGLLAVDSGMAGNYVLGSDISVATTPWNPLGNATGDFAFGTTGFTGIFDGLGHTVDGITRANTSNSTGIGLFGQIGDQFAEDGLVQNLGLTNVNIGGLSEVGALAGANFGTVSNVYSTGQITGGDAVGLNTDEIVAGIGGLIGTNDGTIDRSYSSADVNATTGDQSFGDGTDGGAGGLVGSNFGAIDSSYATGSVTGNRDVGGLVGYVSGTVTASYSSGAVLGTTNVGGLVGDAFTDPFGFGDPVLDSYWNTTTSGQATSAGGGTGLTDAQAQQQSNYTGFDFTNTWIMYDGISQPLLRSLLTPFYVTVDDQSKTYDGTAFTGFTSTESETPRPGVITGTISYAGAGTTATDAGSYTVSASGLDLTNAGKQDQQGYFIEYLDGTLTIDQAALTVTGSEQTKTYGGSLVLDDTAFTNSGLVAGETIGSVTITSASGNDADTGANADTYTGDLQVSNATGGTFNASNYDITYVAGDLVVDQAALTVTADDRSKTYGENLDLGTSQFNASNLANGETIGSVTLTSANATNTGAGADVYLNDIAASNASGGTFNAANYNITYQSGDLTVDKATLTVRADDKSINEGDTLPAFTQTISGFVNGETLGTSDLSGSGEATTTAVDGGPTGNYVITSEQATLASGNYTFDLVDGTLTIGVTTPSTPNPAPGSGTEGAVEIVQETLNKDAQRNGGSGGATTSAGGSLDDVAGTGSNGGTAPGSEAEAIQQGANQFCNNCVDTKEVKSADEVMVDYIAAVGRGLMLMWANEADLTDEQKVERKQAEKNTDSYQKITMEFAKKFPGGQTISTLTQFVEHQFEAEKAAEQAKIANKSLKNARADELVARQNVTASENKLRDAETALAANPDSQENKMAVLTAKLQLNVDKSQYRKTKMAVADAEADAELKAAEVRTAQSKVSLAKAQTLAAMAEEREAEAAALMTDALAAPEKAKQANDVYKSANDESAKKSEEVKQSKLIVELTKAGVVKAKEDVKKAKEKAPTAKFVAVAAAFGAAQAKNESDAAAAIADPNGVYIKTYAKRAAILAQLDSLRRLIGNVVRAQTSINITGAHNDTGKSLLDQISGALKNERSTDVAALQRILDSVKSNAPKAFAKQSEFDTYLAGGGKSGLHADYKPYLDASAYLNEGLKEASLSKVGSDAAGKAAKDSAKIAASLAEEAKQAAQKSGEASASALKLAAEAEAAAASAAADIAEAENRQAVAEKAQKEAEEKARKRAEENAAAMAAKNKAWEDKVRAENAAKAVKIAAIKKMHEDRKAKSDAANQVVNKSEAQLKAEEKARKENALVNAKNELALYVKGAKEAADTAAEAKAAVEEAKTSIANSKAEKIKWETIAAEKAAQIPVTAKAAEVDAKAAKVAMDTFNASEEAAKKAGEDFDALNQIQFNAEKALAIAKRERKSLDVTLKGGNSLELLSSIIQLSNKDQAKIDAADAKVAAAEKKYKELEKNAQDKLKQYNALSKKASADADAANAAAAKAAQSDLLARQTKADKEVAEQNIVIASDNAKNMAVYLKDAEEYAASTEARSKVVSPEVQVRKDRVAKAEAALEELEEI